MRFVCPACEAVFQTGGKIAPVAVTCAACGGPMEADSVQGDRIPTRPYDLNSLKAKLEEERQNAPSRDGQVWYVGVQGRSVGPLTPSGLEGLAARGQLRRGSLVWREGWPAWTPAELVPELREILGLPEAPAAGDPPALPEVP